jgi:hypothetical protein
LTYRTLLSSSATFALPRLEGVDFNSASARSARMFGRAVAGEPEWPGGGGRLAIFLVLEAQWWSEEDLLRSREDLVRKSPLTCPEF